MNDKQKKKLSKLLSKWGVNEEELAMFLKEYDETPDEEDEVVEDADLDVEAEEVDTEKEEAPVDEPLPVDDEVVSDEVNEEVEEPTTEPETEPTDAPVEEPVEAPMEQPMEEPMAEPMEQPMEEPTEPVVDPNETRIATLESTIDELKSALEGQQAKFDAFMENLKKSGVVDFVEEPTPIGIDENAAPSLDSESTMSSTLAQLNSGRRY